MIRIVEIIVDKPETSTSDKPFSNPYVASQNEFPNCQLGNRQLLDGSFRGVFISGCGWMGGNCKDEFRIIWITPDGSIRLGVHEDVVRQLERTGGDQSPEQVVAWHKIDVLDEDYRCPEAFFLHVLLIIYGIGSRSESAEDLFIDSPGLY